MTGLHLAQYRIDAEIGRGGMGIVYRATDSKLDRTVALKVLPPHALASADDRARFHREAKSAAQLSHPHIATIYQVDEVEVEGSLRPFIAMEFIDGDSLADRIAQGPLKLDEAVRIATEVAEALRAAHAKDIVHRDIKSANVMLTREGSAKVLDFGLAKTQASTRLTRQGSTLGTVAYMSPEQARGEEVDGRTDLYSLGTMLYEMVAGRLPFGGDYEQAVLYGIMNEDPEPLTAVRTGVSPELERIVFKLLAKDRRHRYQSAAGLISDLETVDPRGTSGITTRTSIRAAAAPAPSTGAGVARTAAAFAAGAVLVALAWSLWPAEEPPRGPVRMLDVKLAADARIIAADISADGSTLVYATEDLTRDNVFVRDLASGDLRRLAGSAGSLVVEIAPDGQSVLLTKQLTIERTSMRGGSPLLVAEAEEGNPRANWGPPGWVMYEDRQALWKVSLETGEKSPLAVKPEDGSEEDYDWPRLLPDGKTVMATVENTDGTTDIGFWDFESGERLATIVNGGNRAHYLDTGHLVYSIPYPGSPVGNLVAVPFDADRLRTRGPLIPITSDVVAGTMAVSGEGTLVYRRSSAVDLTRRFSRPVAGLGISEFPGINRMISVTPARFGDLELGPDEKRAVLTIQDPSRETGQGTGTDVYVVDLARGNLLQMTYDATGAGPTWLPGGDSIAYVDRSRATQGNVDIVVRAADGTGSPRVLFRSSTGVWDLDISPSGDAATYVLSGYDLFGVGGIVVRRFDTNEVIELTDRRTANRRYPEFSPDGATIVYEQDGQVYTVPADGRGVPFNISTGVGRQPTWSADGGTIYMVGTSALYSRDMQTGVIDLELGFSVADNHFYDVFASGDRVLMTNPASAAGISETGDAPVPADSTESMVFVINWAQTLR